MRSYSVTDLFPEDVEKLKKLLTSKGYAGSMDDFFWIPLPDSLREPEQRDHADECGPFCFALDVERTYVTMELLVRARNKIRCSCVTYATPAQRAFAIDTLDGFFKDLDIPV